jgi:hypothetical protein
MRFQDKRTAYPFSLSGLKALCNPLAVSLGRTSKRAEGDGEGVEEGVPLIISELEAEGAKLMTR